MPPVPTVHQPEAAAARSLTDQAYYRIRELIVLLELAPGAFVNERDLMERVGLGRTPVREALRALARDRLVEVLPRRGVFIAPIHVGDLAGLSEVRLALEPYAARLAAERRTPADRDDAVTLLQELDEAGDDTRLLIELDQRIHRHVWSCAHSPFLARTLEQYYVLALRIWFLALDRVAQLEEAVHEHRELLETIRDGDPVRAEASMRRHVAAFEQAMRTVL
jgi:DNA-binding GntR family transcriptional regulator